MTPYGILYRENIHAFEESMTVWQKKFGILKFSSLIKLFALFLIEIILCTLIFIFMKADAVYILISFIVGIVLSVVTYYTVLKKVAKNTAIANFSARDTLKQVVLFEDRMECTSSFAKSVYYYDEIKSVYEKNGIITIIFSKYTVPCSIPYTEIIKGDYRKFMSILKEKAASIYEFGGGNV